MLLIAPYRTNFSLVGQELQKFRIVKTLAIKLQCHLKNTEAERMMNILRNQIIIVGFPAWEEVPISISPIRVVLVGMLHSVKPLAKVTQNMVW